MAAAQNIPVALIKLSEEEPINEEESSSKNFCYLMTTRGRYYKYAYFFEKESQGSENQFLVLKEVIEE